LEEHSLPQFLYTLENFGISQWIRDTPSLFGFWFILAVHAIGMAMLVGGSTIIALRILGIARDLPIAPLKGLSRIIWAGFWIQFVSGGLLLLSYATKSLTNYDFYLKMVLIAAGLAVTQIMMKRVFGDSGASDAELMARGKVLAVASLLLWLGTVTSGRMLAYTYTYVLYP
jgi:hypothetical protein